MKRFFCLLIALLLMIPCAFAEESKTEADLWLEEKALELAVLFNEALQSDAYITLFVSDASILTAAKELRQTDFSKPGQVQVLRSNSTDDILSSVLLQGDFSTALQTYLNHKAAIMLPHASLSQSSSSFLALNSILAMSNAYVCPEEVTGNAYVLLTYNGDYSLCVTFTRLDTGAITAQTTLILGKAFPLNLPF